MPIHSPQERPPDPFVLFVRAREGHIVRRFGTSQSIGYTYKPAVGSPPALDQRGRVLAPGKVTEPHEHRWDTATIHAITADEYDAHRKEYDAELFDPKTNPDGGLEVVTREAWDEQRASRAAEEKTRAALIAKGHKIHEARERARGKGDEHFMTKLAAALKSGKLITDDEALRIAQDADKQPAAPAGSGG